MFQDAHFLHGVGCLEHGRAGHKHVRSRFDEAAARFAVHAAVNFDQGVRTRLLYEAAQAARLVEAMLYELLSAKTGIDAFSRSKSSEKRGMFM